MRCLMLVVVLVFGGCASTPPSLSPAGVISYQANEAVLIIGQTQNAAIELNKIQRCEPAPSVVCTPLLSDRNTGVVVDAATDGLTTLRAVPAGWRATTSAAIDRIAMRLDAAGQAKFSAYLQAARSMLAAIP